MEAIGTGEGAHVQEKAPTRHVGYKSGGKGLKAEQSAFEDSISLEEKYYQLPVRTDKNGKADINTPEFKLWFGDSKVVDEDKSYVLFIMRKYRFDKINKI